MSGRNGRDQGYSKDFINRHMKAVKTNGRTSEEGGHRSGVYEQTFYCQWATSTVSRSKILGALRNEDGQHVPRPLFSKSCFSFSRPAIIRWPREPRRE